MSANPFPRPVNFPSRGWLLTALAAVLWLAGLWFFTRHNDFPIYYHPDEGSKGEQIVSGELNFHHPLLLLDTAKLILRIMGKSVTVENAVHAGRMASAIFAASSVVLLAALAWRVGGWKAGLLAALLVGVHPLLYELAHYCKEDPALLLGLSAGMLMLDVFLARPSLARAVGLGAACGLAASGKYLGIVLLPIVVTVLIVRFRSDKKRLASLLGVCLVGFAAVVAVINLPYLLEPAALKRGLSYELHAAQLGGNKGLSRDVPHDKYLGVFLNNLSWPLWAGLALFACDRLLRKKGSRTVCLLLLVFPLAYALLISFSPKTASRYFLAVSPFLILAASIGIAGIGGFFPQRWKRWRIVSTAFGVALAVVAQRDLFIPSWNGFQGDSRREMSGWMNENLSPNTLLLAETRIHLSKLPTWSGMRREDLQIEEGPFLPDFGTSSEMRAKGVGTVATIRTSFGGFMDEKRKPVKSLEEQHRRRATFYRNLFAKGRLLHKTGGSGVGILNPEIRLYELPLAD